MTVPRGPRVVSLVPSLTEAVAVTLPGALVGATDWCTHPADLGSGVVRIGGTKNPDVERIIALAPDLVIANEEENRAPDLAALRAAGLDVLVTEIRDLPGALRELERVLRACGSPAGPLAGRGRGGLGRTGASHPAVAGGGAGVAAPLDGARQGHLRR